MRRISRHFVVWMSYKGAVRVTLAAVVITLVTILLTQRMAPASSWTYWTLPLSGKTIVIDAGHGGVDGGAISKQGLIEKDLNLAIALQLRDYLQQSGALVIMTREGDYDLASEGQRSYSKRKTEDLKKRVALIEEQQPAAVISIHMNSIPSSKWSGAQTFYHPNSIAESRTLATLIQNELRDNLQNTTRMAGEVTEVYLLKALEKTPVALVEVGFLSNPGEASRLADSEYQRMVAASIYKGILRFSSGETIQTSSKP